MLRQTATTALTPWNERVHDSLVVSFANGAATGDAPAPAVIPPPWSDNQTERQIIKLKLVDRQMHARAKIDRLQGCLIGADRPVAIKFASGPILRTD
jgi:hypothetical protein